MKFASTKKIALKNKNKFRYLTLAIFSFLSVISAQKALSGYPSLYQANLLLNISHNECKAKANKVANLVFSNVYGNHEGQEFLMIVASTSTISASLYCIKQGAGSYFVVYTSGGFFDSPFAQDDRKIIDQIKTYMMK